MKKKQFFAAMGIGILIAAIVLAVTETKVTNSPKASKRKPKEELTTIGFSQVGAESDWRTANSISIKKTFTPERGYELIFDDAKQMQSNQIKAIRSFIQQDVDFIIFAPVVETGWDTVLEEARRAGIPVIVIDRRIAVKDSTMYTAWIGSDFYLQGQKACKALMQYVEDRGMEEVNIVNIQGTLGATAQIQRTRALEEAAKKYGWNLLAQESGEYTEALAYEVMSEILKEQEEINFVYCENDNEAFGVIEAVKAAGKTIGPDGDIQIISFDATKEGLRCTMEGQILMNLECNPLQGHYIEKVIDQIQEGRLRQKEWYVPEQIFVGASGISEIMVGGKVYKTQEVTEELLQLREY